MMYTKKVQQWMGFRLWMPGFKFPATNTPCRCCVHFTLLCHFKEWWASQGHNISKYLVQFRLLSIYYPEYFGFESTLLEGGRGATYTTIRAKPVSLQTLGACRSLNALFSIQTWILSINSHWKYWNIPVLHVCMYVFRKYTYLLDEDFCI